MARNFKNPYRPYMPENPVYTPEHPAQWYTFFDHVPREALLDLIVRLGAAGPPLNLDVEEGTPAECGSCHIALDPDPAYEPLHYVECDYRMAQSINAFWELYEQRND